MIITLKMAMRSIGSNKLRSMLTMLGIIIGVMALVVLVSLVEGASESVTDRIASLGTNFVRAYIFSPENGITYDELQGWAENEPLIENLGVEVTPGTTIKYGTNTTEARVTGCSPAMYDIQGMQLVAGRFIKNVDMANVSRVVVLGPGAVESVVGDSNCIGEELTIAGLKYTIIGVLGESNSLHGGYNEYGEPFVYIPFSTLGRNFPDQSPLAQMIFVTPPDGTDMSEVEDVVNSYLTERVGYDDSSNKMFTVYSQDVVQRSMGEVDSTLSVLLGCIASISLIVGGIGIMNIMLVTVSERTREIGIRKALGASRGAILRQFLLEAVVLSMMGCLVGIFLSWCTLRLVTVVVEEMNMTFSLSGKVVLLSMIFCFSIGVIFGIYPAGKAARMNPIDALHYGG